MVIKEFRRIYCGFRCSVGINERYCRCMEEGLLGSCVFVLRFVRLWLEMGFRILVEGVLRGIGWIERVLR